MRGVPRIAWKTHLEKKKNWLQPKELWWKTLQQQQPVQKALEEEFQGVLSLFHSLPSFFFNYGVLGARESVCVAAEKSGTGRSGC